MLNRMQVCAKRLVEHRDSAVAYASAVAAVLFLLFVIIFMPRLQFLAAGILLLLLCVIWLAIRKTASLRSLDSLEHLNAYLAFSALFFLFLALSILSVHFRPDLYSRPITYYVCVAFAAGVLSAAILVAPRGKKFFVLPLFQIIILGLAMQLTEMSIFNGLIGIDPWQYHTYWVSTVTSGHFPALTPYTDFSLSLILEAATSLFTGLSYRNAAAVCGGGIQILLNVSFLYLLGSYVANKKVGALAAVLCTTATMNIFMSIWVIPTTVAAPLALALIYTLFRFHRDRPMQGLAIAALLGAGLVLWHPLTSFSTILLLFAGFVACIVFGLNGTSRLQRPISFSFALLYSVELFSWWTYKSGYINRLVTLTSARFSPSLFIYVPAQVSAFYQAVSGLESLLVNGGTFIFLAGGFLGCLFMISKRFASPIAAATAVIGIVPAIFVPLAVLTNTFLLDERWLYYANIFLAIPLAIGFLVLVLSSRHDGRRVAVLMSLVIVLAFAMMLSPLANIDNSSLQPNTVVRYAYSDSELAFVNFALSHPNQTVSTDGAYERVLYWSGNATNTSLNVGALDFSLANATFAHNESLIVIRSYIVNNTFREFAGPYRLTYDPNAVLADSRFNLVYDDGGVRGYT